MAPAKFNPAKVKFTAHELYHELHEGPELLGPTYSMSRTDPERANMAGGNYWQSGGRYNERNRNFNQNYNSYSGGGGGGGGARQRYQRFDEGEETWGSNPGNFGGFQNQDRANNQDRPQNQDRAYNQDRYQNQDRYSYQERSQGSQWNQSQGGQNPANYQNRRGPNQYNPNYNHQSEGPRRQNYAQNRYYIDENDDWSANTPAENAISPLQYRGSPHAHHEPRRYDKTSQQRTYQQSTNQRGGERDSSRQDTEEHWGNKGRDHASRPNNIEKPFANANVEKVDLTNGNNHVAESNQGKEWEVQNTGGDSQLAAPETMTDKDPSSVIQEEDEAAKNAAVSISDLAALIQKDFDVGPELSESMFVTKPRAKPKPRIEPTVHQQELPQNITPLPTLQQNTPIVTATSQTGYASELVDNMIEQLQSKCVITAKPVTTSQPEQPQYMKQNAPQDMKVQPGDQTLLGQVIEKKKEEMQQQQQQQGSKSKKKMKQMQLEREQRKKNVADAIKESLKNFEVQAAHALHVIGVDKKPEHCKAEELMVDALRNPNIEEASQSIKDCIIEQYTPEEMKTLIPTTHLVQVYCFEGLKFLISPDLAEKSDLEKLDIMSEKLAPKIKAAVEYLCQASGVSNHLTAIVRLTTIYSHVMLQPKISPGLFFLEAVWDSLYRAGVITKEAISEWFATPCDWIFPQHTVMLQTMHWIEWLQHPEHYVAKIA